MIKKIFIILAILKSINVNAEPLPNPCEILSVKIAEAIMSSKVDPTLMDVYKNNPELRLYSETEEKIIAGCSFYALKKENQPSVTLHLSEPLKRDDAKAKLIVQLKKDKKKWNEDVIDGNTIIYSSCDEQKPIIKECSLVTTSKSVTVSVLAQNINRDRNAEVKLLMVDVLKKALNSL